MLIYVSSKPVVINRRSVEFNDPNRPYNKENFN